MRRVCERTAPQFWWRVRSNSRCSRRNSRRLKAAQEDEARRSISRRELCLSGGRQALYCAGVTPSPLRELLPRTKIVSARPRPCTGCASPREAVPRRCGRYPRRHRAREKWAAHPRRARRAMRAIISAIFSLGLTAAVARAGGCRTPSSTAPTGTGSRSASRWATGCAAGFSTTAAARWSVGAGVSTGCRARWWVVELHLGGAHRRPHFTHHTG